MAKSQNGKSISKIEKIEEVAEKSNNDTPPKVVSIQNYINPSYPTFQKEQSQKEVEVQELKSREKSKECIGFDDHVYG